MADPNEEDSLAKRLAALKSASIINLKSKNPFLPSTSWAPETTLAPRLRALRNRIDDDPDASTLAEHDDDYDEDNYANDGDAYDNINGQDKHADFFENDNVNDLDLDQLMDELRRELDAHTTNNQSGIEPESYADHHHSRNSMSNHDADASAEKITEYDKTAQKRVSAKNSDIDDVDDDVYDQDNAETIPSLPSVPLSSPRTASARHIRTSLPIKFPSVPSTLPRDNPRDNPRTRARASTHDPDPDPDPDHDRDVSWCVICLQDATLHCLGCDDGDDDDGKDLYCNRCWIEMHLGPFAGYDERSHKAVRLLRGDDVEAKSGKGNKSKKRLMAGA